MKMMLRVDYMNLYSAVGSDEFVVYTYIHIYLHTHTVYAKYIYIISSINCSSV